MSIIGSISQRIQARKMPNRQSNNYFNPSPSLPPPRKQQEYGQNPMLPPEVKPDERIHQLQSIQMRKDKNEYIIGDTKEDIIENIIKEKPSVANVRKAFTVYADLVMDEDIF